MRPGRGLLKNSPARNPGIYSGPELSLRMVAAAAQRVHVHVSVGCYGVSWCISRRCDISASRIISAVISGVCDGIATSATGYRRFTASWETVLRQRQRSSAREESGNNRDTFQGDHDHPPNAYAYPTHFMHVVCSEVCRPRDLVRFIAIHYKSA